MVWEDFSWSCAKNCQKSLQMFQQLRASSVLFLKAANMVGMDYDLMSRFLLWGSREFQLTQWHLSEFVDAPLVHRRDVQWVLLLDDIVTEHLATQQFEWWHPDSSYTSFTFDFLSCSWSCWLIIASSWARANDRVDTLLGQVLIILEKMFPIVLGILYLKNASRY